MLYVTNAGRTKREQISQAMESLKSVDARVLGVVFNMVGLNSSGSSGYSYGYGYYGYYGEGGAKKHWWQRGEAPAPAVTGAAPQPADLPEARPVGKHELADHEETPSADVKPELDVHETVTTGDPELRPVDSWQPEFWTIGSARWAHA